MEVGLIPLPEASLGLLLTAVRTLCPTQRISPILQAMGGYYDEIEIEDMAWDEEAGVFHYPCPCGDRFEISRDQLVNCEDIAICPSCSLIIRVIYDPVSSAVL